MRTLKFRKKNKAQTIDLDVWIAWCAGGDHVAGKTEEEVTERAEHDLLGPMVSCAKITVTVPLPNVLEAKTAIEPEEALALVFVQN